jgi:hypothetical protein
LDWITYSEINNDYFTIERSQDGIDFEAIEDINGAGTSDQAIFYESLDPTPYLGTSYYRLRQTDFDGTQSISPVRAVHIDIQGQFSVYPNPMSEVLYVTNDGS